MLWYDGIKQRREEDLNMATVSMEKEFFVHDKNAFEQLEKEISKNVRKTNSPVKESSSLKYGEEKLKEFLFR